MRGGEETNIRHLDYSVKKTGREKWKFIDQRGKKKKSWRGIFIHL